MNEGSHLIGPLSCPSIFTAANASDTLMSNPWATISEKHINDKRGGTDIEDR